MRRRGPGEKGSVLYLISDTKNEAVSAGNPFSMGHEPRWAAQDASKIGMICDFSGENLPAFLVTHKNDVL